MKTLWITVSEEEFTFMNKVYGLENAELLLRPVIKAEMEKHEEKQNKSK